MVRSSSRLVRKPLPVDDPRRRCPDITRATQLLGWTPRTSLDVGLKNTIAWFANQREPGEFAARDRNARDNAVVA